MNSRLAARLAAPLVALALTGCSQEVTLDEQDLEQEISTQLEEMAGQAPDRIDCPGDLEAEEGTEMRCVLNAGEDKLGVTVTVTEVDGENVNFDIEVDEEMME